MSGIDKKSTTQPNLADLLSLQVAARLGNLSASHLRRLVRRGEVWGIKLGHNWFTTDPAMKQYLAYDRKPGPKKLESS